MAPKQTRLENLLIQSSYHLFEKVLQFLLSPAIPSKADLLPQLI